MSVPNLNLSARFLDVPCCNSSLDNVTTATPTSSMCINNVSSDFCSNVISRNSNSSNNNNHVNVSDDPSKSLLGNSLNDGGGTMTRSVSANCNFLRDYSPPPARKKPGFFQKRSSNNHRQRTKSAGCSDEHEIIPLMSQNANKGRLRLSSTGDDGDDENHNQGQGRRGSHTGGINHLTIPSSYQMTSRSLNDVSCGNSGHPHANNLGQDGSILRNSCLALGSDGKKRHGKTPPRVSFKVS